MSNASDAMATRLKKETTRRAQPLVKEDDVRARVLEAAVRMIDEGGLASLSMREVARRAGVSHQAPYHYFPDRESILAALAEEGFIRLYEELDEVRDAASCAADRLAHAGEAYVRFAQQHPAHFRLMFRPDFVDIERFPSVMDCGQKAFERLIELVHSCIEEGLPAEPSEQALVVFGWSVVHGLACLLIDNTLALKLPEEAAAVVRTGLARGTKSIVSDVMEAFRAVLVARSTPPKPRAQSSPKPTRRRKKV